jgi:hypothetical protein
MARAALALALWLLTASVGAQRAAAFPASLRGMVHRTRVFGCGQSWDASEAWSDTTLAIHGGRATLTIDARWRDATGGVRRLLDGEGEAGPYHSEIDHHAQIAWTGRARREGALLRIALGRLTETREVQGTRTTVTSRSTLAATLVCAHEERDVLGPTRPAELAHEAPLARRSLVSCGFEAAEREPPLPRPVAELLTLPFLLDAEPGITTDADYDGAFRADAPYLVAREPGGMHAPSGPIAP